MEPFLISSLELFTGQHLHTAAPSRVEIKDFCRRLPMEYWEQASPISSHTYDHARTANALPMTKYRTATYTRHHTYDFSLGGC